MDAASIPTVAGILATTISQGRTVDEIAVLAAVFTQLGQNLTFVAALKAIENREITL